MSICGTNILFKRQVKFCQLYMSTSMHGWNVPFEKFYCVVINNFGCYPDLLYNKNVCCLYVLSENDGRSDGYDHSEFKKKF